MFEPYLTRRSTHGLNRRLSARLVERRGNNLCTVQQLQPAEPKNSVTAPPAKPRTRVPCSFSEPVFTDDADSYSARRLKRCWQCPKACNRYSCNTYTKFTVTLVTPFFNMVVRSYNRNEVISQSVMWGRWVLQLLYWLLIYCPHKICTPDSCIRFGSSPKNCNSYDENWCENRYHIR